MTANTITLITLVVTILGWFFTYTKQKELARVQGDIQKNVSEHSMRFESLHRRRGDVIDELYKRIDKISKLLQNSIRKLRFAGESSPEEQQKDAYNVIGEMVDYYYQNRLYLDQPLRQAMEEFVKTLGEYSKNISSATLFARWSEDRMMRTEQIGFVEKAEKIVSEDLPLLQELIELEMRTILGIR